MEKTLCTTTVHWGPWPIYQIVFMYLKPLLNNDAAAPKMLVFLKNGQNSQKN